METEEFDLDTEKGRATFRRESWADSTAGTASLRLDPRY
jgi:hypothetical protein